MTQIMQTFEGVDADQMYREHILDHYKNPRNKGILKNALHQHENNPLCGDEVDIYMTFDGDKIKEVSFVSQGCAISQASASILTESIKNKNISTITTMKQHDMKELLGIDVTPMRVKCMMLPLKAAKMIIFRHLGRVTEGDEHD
ncbi:MAG TPA: SUF system NifU family Fe-S cluster assembly protein [Candidatus Nanoarchaeia archaeon]|nr:SUF system NifU family Fe-S cluster assembly protein [Candidatus Nanoarchaeia archaeon]